MIQYKCPKCQQQDKGFRKEALLCTIVDKMGMPIRLTSGNSIQPNPHVIPHTEIYWCNAEECDWSGSYGEVTFEVHPDGTTSR